MNIIEKIATFIGINEKENQYNNEPNNSILIKKYISSEVDLKNEVLVRIFNDESIKITFFLLAKKIYENYNLKINNYFIDNYYRLINEKKINTAIFLKALEKGFSPSKSLVLKLFNRNLSYSINMLEELSTVKLASDSDFDEIKNSLEGELTDNLYNNVGFKLPLVAKSFSEAKNELTKLITSGNVKQLAKIFVIFFAFIDKVKLASLDNKSKNHELFDFNLYSLLIGKTSNLIDERDQIGISLTSYFSKLIVNKFGKEKLKLIFDEIILSENIDLIYSATKYLCKYFFESEDLIKIVISANIDQLKENLLEIILNIDDISSFLKKHPYDFLKKLKKDEAIKFALSQEKKHIFNLILLANGIFNTRDKYDMTGFKSDNPNDFEKNNYLDSDSTDLIKKFVYDFSSLQKFLTDLENDNMYLYEESDYLKSIFYELSKLDYTSGKIELYHSRYGKARQIKSFISLLKVKVLDFFSKNKKKDNDKNDDKDIAFLCLELILESIKMYEHVSNNVIEHLKNLNEFVADRTFDSGIWFSGRDGIPLSLAVKASYWGMNFGKRIKYSKLIKDQIEININYKNKLIKDAILNREKKNLNTNISEEQLLEEGIQMHYDTEARIYDFVKFANISRILIYNCESSEEKLNLISYLKSCGVTSKMLAIDTGLLGSVIKSALVLLYGGSSSDYKDNIRLMFSGDLEIKSLIKENELGGKVLETIEYLPKKTTRVIYVDQSGKQYSFDQGDDIRLLSWVVDQCIIRHFVPTNDL